MDEFVPAREAAFSDLVAALSALSLSDFKKGAPKPVSEVELKEVRATLNIVRPGDDMLRARMNAMAKRPGGAAALTNLVMAKAAEEPLAHEALVHVSPALYPLLIETLRCKTYGPYESVDPATEDAKFRDVATRKRRDGNLVAFAAALRKAGAFCDPIWDYLLAEVIADDSDAAVDLAFRVLAAVTPKEKSRIRDWAGLLFIKSTGRTQSRARDLVDATA